MLKFKIYISLWIFLISVMDLFSQVSIPNKIEAFRTDSAVMLDGLLDEDCWDKAMRISNFTQREQTEGAPVTERTEVAVVYSREKMYIGVWCYETEPDKIMAKHMKRDFPYWTDDNFEIIFDTFLDKQNGYVFVINPNGSRSDVQTSQNGRIMNMDWNGVWDAAVKVDSTGWFGEIEIPFSTLKFPDKSIQEWGVNFERNIRRKKEQAFWQGWSRNYDFEHVAHAGRINGIHDIYGRENVELKPFLTSGIQTQTGKPDNTLAKIGGDINYLITPTLKMNLTINTDFAQVESDRAQINLSRFSLFYPEKRDFFLEGKSAFEYDFYDAAKVFYTRRIGLQDGRQIPIIAGARLLGKQGGTNIGLLSIQTAARGDIQAANYSLARLSQDVLENSSVGMIVTAKNQGGHYNYVYGVDGRYASTSFMGDKNLIATGFLSRSDTKGISPGRSLSYGGFLTYPNDLFDGGIGLVSLQKNFNPEMGFLERENVKLLYGEIGYSPRPEFLPWVSRLSIRPMKFVGFYDDITNKPQTVILQIRPLGVTFKSGDWAAVGIDRNLESLQDTFHIFSDRFIPTGDYWFTRYSVEIQTFEGRSLSVYAIAKTGTYFDGTAWGYYGSLSWNLSRFLNLSLDYSRDNISLKSGRFTTGNVGGRIDLAFNPKLNTGFFGQWNNVDKVFLLNFRLNWIPVVGSDFYLAVNQAVSTENKAVSLKETAVLGKFIWRFTI